MLHHHDEYFQTPELKDMRSFSMCRLYSYDITLNHKPWISASVLFLKCQSQMLFWQVMWCFSLEMHSSLKDFDTQLGNQAPSLTLMVHDPPNSSEPEFASVSDGHGSAIITTSATCLKHTRPDLNRAESFPTKLYIRAGPDRMTVRPCEDFVSDTT